jgi:ankyrin repeat protein
MKLVIGSLLVTSMVSYGAVSEVAEAASRGDKAGIQKLVAAKANVNATQNDGATALHWAVFRSDKEMVDMLLKAGADPKAANRDGSTPLWLASVNGDAAILTSLLGAGADVNEKLPLGRTPLMAASRTGNVAAMKVLIDKGANLNAAETLRGTTAMMWAADEGHEAAIQYLIERGADIKARSALVERGRGPALGKANDPRRQVATQVAALAAGQALDLGAVAALRGDGNGIGAAGANAGANAAGGRAGANAGRGGNAGRGNAGGGRAANAGAAAGANAGAADGADQGDDAAAAFGFGGGGRNNQAVKDGGALTPLHYAARANDLESVKVLLAAGANVNEVSGYGWSPLLIATQNRYYRLAAYLIERGADVNLTNKGQWTPLYLATDNRNIESGDYPVRKGDMDHLEFIKLLLDKGANPNARMKDSSQTRTVFTNQWLDENGATAFLRASQSGDIALMKLLLSRGADPKINTLLNVSPLHVAAGIGWVEGITYEWSEEATDEAVKMLLDLGLDPNLQADTGRVALHGAGHKGRSKITQMLVDKGAKLDIRDYGNTDARGSLKMAVHTWQPIDYADGLVRVGVQSAIAHPETANLMRKLMIAQGLPAPPEGRTLESICITEACE